MNNPKLIIFTAPSGAGKTTLVRYLLGKLDQLAFSTSATTRPQRTHEVNGRDYHFIDTATFEQKIAQNEFLEWEEVYDGNYYGTLKSEINKITAAGKFAIFDVDVKGAINIKRQYPESAIVVFIKAPSMKELESRLRNRQTESEESLLKRLKRASLELTYEPNFDQTVINDDLDLAKNDALKIVSGFIKPK